MSKDDIIRFRCEGDLKERFEALAKLERRKPSDLARIIVEDYCAEKENALHDRPAQVGGPNSDKVESALKAALTYTTRKPRKAR